MPAVRIIQKTAGLNKDRNSQDHADIQRSDWDSTHALVETNMFGHGTPLHMAVVPRKVTFIGLLRTSASEMISIILLLMPIPCGSRSVSIVL